MRGPGPHLSRRDGFLLAVVPAGGGARRHQREPEDELEVVIGCDSVVSLEVARQAAVHDRVLAVGTDEGADGLHRTGTGAGAVAGDAPIHVTRVEAIRAVIAVAAPEGNRADHGFAVRATKRLLQIAGSRA